MATRRIKKTNIEHYGQRWCLAQKWAPQVTHIVNNNLNDMDILNIEEMMILIMHSNKILEIIKMSQTEWTIKADNSTEIPALCIIVTTQCQNSDEDFRLKQFSLSLANRWDDSDFWLVCAQ